MGFALIFISSFLSTLYQIYLRNKNKPTMANATPMILCHDGGSRKKRIPAIAMICCAASQNCRNRRERSALLKKKKERDRASADAHAREQRIIRSGPTEFLISPSREPEDCQIKQARQCGAGFDNETAEAFANALGRKTSENLMS